MSAGKEQCLLVECGTGKQKQAAGRQVVDGFLLDVFRAHYSELVLANDSCQGVKNPVKAAAATTNAHHARYLQHEDELAQQTQVVRAT